MERLTGMTFQCTEFMPGTSATAEGSTAVPPTTDCIETASTASNGVKAGSTASNGFKTGSTAFDGSKTASVGPEGSSASTTATESTTSTAPTASLARTATPTASNVMFDVVIDSGWLGGNTDSDGGSAAHH